MHERVRCVRPPLIMSWRTDVEDRGAGHFMHVGLRISWVGLENHQGVPFPLVLAETVPPWSISLRVPSFDITEKLMS